MSEHSDTGESDSVEVVAAVAKVEELVQEDVRFVARSFLFFSFFSLLSLACLLSSFAHSWSAM